ncbi:MAG: carboxypeptidase regulatory-like domain-containing protein [Planctomycetes bacterium]|nr:carboxypeptidase regulatory-like domain-containing protein [Planctomycetota bacterium]
MNARRLVLGAVAVALIALGVWFAATRSGESIDVATADRDARMAPTPTAPAVPLETPDAAAGDAGITREERRVDETPSAGDERHFVVRGKVFDAASGEPWFGATIEARYAGGDTLLDTESDEDGRYELVLEGGVPARLDFVAFVEERAALMHAGLATAGKHELTVDFAVPGAFVVAGRVLDAKTSAPIPGAEIRVFADGAAFAEGWNDGFSDKEGRFTIDELSELPRTGLHVVALAEERQPLHLVGLEVPANSDTLRVELALEPLRVLRGRVVDATNGAPIADARVETSATSDAFAEGGSESRSDANGDFEVELGELPATDALLYVQAKGYATVARDVSSWNDGDEIRLGAPTKLAGRVLDAATKTPLADVELALEPFGLPESVAVEYQDNATTDADGRFELTLEAVPLGHARLVAASTGFAPTRLEVATPTNSTVTVELERAIHVRGIVRRAGDGAPVDGARVRALFGDDRGSVHEVAETEKDGEYELELPVSTARAARWVVEYRGRRRGFGALEFAQVPPAEVVRDFEVDLPLPRGVRVEKLRKPPNDDQEE